MTQLANLSAHAVGQALENAGFTLRRTNKGHRIYFRQVPEPPRIVVVPDHREIRPGTLRSVIRQSGMEVSDFMALCPSRR